MTEVGRPIPMREARQRVTGSLPFAVDARVPGMLHGKIVRSTCAHGVIHRLDVSAAAGSPGVVGVLVGGDLVGAEIESHYGPVIPDRPLLAIERVRFSGEPVAAVIAVDEDAAAAACELVDVRYEDLPVLATPEEAMALDAPDIHDAIPLRERTPFPDIVLHPGAGKNVCNHFRLRHGDVAEGFAEADEIFEDVFRTPAQQHCNLEPHVAVVAIEPGQATVWTSAASPYTVRFQVAETLRLPESAVRVVVSNVGGAYGSKTYPRLEPLVAAMSWRVGGRPVRVELTRTEEFFTITRHAATVHLRTGVRCDGTILAREARILWSAGAYADISPRLIKNGGYSSAGPYRIPHVAVDSYAVYTNVTPAGGFRGYAIPQVAWAYESQMDLIADRLGIDPVELRLQNLLRDGDEFATGQTVEDFHLGELVQTVSERIGWSGPGPTEPSAPGLVRGKGIACTLKTTVTPSTSTAAIKLNEDGSASLLTSTVEIGQGARTVLAQIAADALGIAVDRIVVSYPDTDATPWDQTTSSSRSTLMMGGAVEEAGLALRRELLALAAPLLSAPIEALTAEEGLVWPGSERNRAVGYGEIVRRSGRRNLVQSGVNQSPGGLDPETGQGVVTPHFFHAAAGAEVEVDLETGVVRVVDLHVETYAGKVVNPVLASLQCEGNVAFGVGQALFEEIELDGGQIVNPTLADYMIPSLRDLPERWTVGLAEDPAGRVHGLGETGAPPVPAAIGNALFHASGVRLTTLPLTPEKVLAGLREVAAARRDPAPLEAAARNRA